MFAIIEDGGRQYYVKPGDRLQIDLRNGVEKDGEITFDKVLLGNGGGSSVLGSPVIEGATVAASIVDPLKKGPKLEIQKMRRRKNSKRHTGHRQKHTIVQINAINVPGLEVVEKKDDAKKEEAAAAE